MILFNVLQVALLGYAAWLCVDRMREVQLRLRVDAKPLARAIADRLLAGDPATARAIADATGTSAFGRVVAPLLAGHDAKIARAEVDEAFADVEADLERGVLALRSIGSIAVAAGFCGAALHMGSFLADHAEAAALDLGALEGAMSTMALGIATAFPALAGHRILKRARHDIAQDVDYSVSIVEAATRGERPARRAALLDLDDDDDDASPRNRRPRGMSQDA
ncbi:MAG: MotA/TolQ/ExbB proton channel family protein [Deltaproteobacteria bacterium]|nr:MotA/TolQ/ExbB proton channel family protein [Deltaproteobacteria bacterium]